MREIPANDFGLLTGDQPVVIANATEPIAVPQIGFEDIIDAGVADNVQPIAELVPETVFSSPQAMDLKNSLRIVVVGGSDRLPISVLENFRRGLVTKPLSCISFPLSRFAAGIQAACADVLIFDILKVDILELQEFVKQARQFSPRAIMVVLLEDGMPDQTIPETIGVHLVVTTPFTAYGIAQRIDSLLFG